MELKEGLFHIDAKAYHAMPGLSYTGVKEFLRSPAHYKAMLAGEIEETAAMRFGSAYHCYNLEHDFFHREFIVKPDDISLRSKDGHEWVERHKGFTIISEKEMNQIRAMADVLWSHPHWKKLAPYSEREIAMIWKNKEHDIWCRTRIDLLQPAFSMPVDLKTTQDARAESFLLSAWRFGYHIQVAWTLMGLEAVTGQKHEAFTFFAQEKTPPYSLRVYEVTPDFIQAGYRAVEHVLPYYAQCLRTDNWPGYSEEVKPLAAPIWAEDTINDDVVLDEGNVLE